jgi:hypothetical protein
MSIRVDRPTLADPCGRAAGPSDFSDWLTRGTLSCAGALTTAASCRVAGVAGPESYRVAPFGSC